MLLEKTNKYRFNIKIKGKCTCYKSTEFETTEEKLIEMTSKLFDMAKRNEIIVNIDDFPLLNRMIPKQTQIDVYDENNNLVLSYIGK